MKVNVRNRILCLCLLLTLGALWLPAQETPPQPPPQPQSKPAQPTAKPRPSTPARPLEVSTSDGSFSLELFYWITGKERPLMSPGKTPTPNGVSLMDFPGGTKPAPGAVLSVPGGGENNVRFSFFVTKGQGNTTATQDLNFFNAFFVPGDFLVTRYTLQSGKISYEYLTFPNPATSKFRIKTLWELQGTFFKTSIDGPFKPDVLDFQGNRIPTTGLGTDFFVLPTFGIGVEHFASRHFYWQAKASGFGLPHRANTWDLDARAALRFGHFEFQAGARGFHFKTSPKGEEYVKATLWGPYLSLQWSPFR